mmetsp:Transcript_18985/g.24615  ORF Transcript_18985/g.24615 Transcript_18985/m.24615 type:complete len:422 (-) Transcript_18985:100-1365(-)
MQNRLTGPRLCLHLDVNETLILGDEAGGDTFAESLHKIIAKQAIIRCRSEKTEISVDELLDNCTWNDGRSLRATMERKNDDISPELFVGWHVPENYVRFYRTEPLKKAYAKRFCDEGSPGACYAPIQEKADMAMRWNENDMEAKHIALRRGPYRYIIPAFWRLLEHLVATKRRATLIIRTYGSDLSDIAAAFKAYAEYKNDVQYNGLADLIKPEHCFKVQRTDTGMKFTRNDGIELNEAQALEEMERDDVQIRCLGFLDDYYFWKSRGHDPSAGKPLWLGHVSARHIFLDDNIHNDPINSIVAIRLKTPDSNFRSLDGYTTLRLQNIALVRVPTIQVVLNPDWFIERLLACENNIEKLLAFNKCDDASSTETTDLRNWRWFNFLLLQNEDNRSILWDDSACCSNPPPPLLLEKANSNPPLE